jgi:plasmid stabilization system protein ParE
VTRARFTREARAEFLAQTAYYEAIREGLGTRFRAEIEQAAALAATYPHHGKPGPAGTRRRLVAGFPFKLIYSQTDGGVLIHAVAGDHQLPEYWLSRLGHNER